MNYSKKYTNLVVDGRLYERARASTADLALVEKERQMGQFHRFVH